MQENSASTCARPVQNVAKAGGRWAVSGQSASSARVGSALQAGRVQESCSPAPLSATSANLRGRGVSSAVSSLGSEVPLHRVLAVSRHR